MTRSKVYVRFPKAGLGNMLLTWSRAYVFAKVNNLEMHTSPWTTIHPGAWLRNENKKRFYHGYFKQTPFFTKIRLKWSLLTSHKVFEPPVTRLDDTSKKQTYVFHKIFTDYDFFKDIRPYKTLVKQGILDMLQPSLKKIYDTSNRPVIGIHIRRGDFKKGSTITPLPFFIEVIQELRREAGSLLHVTIFTDANLKELSPIMMLPNINIAGPLADILDLLLLSESEIAVLSIGSTFSYWAGFLSDHIVIKNEKEWHVPFGTNTKTETKWKSKIIDPEA